MLCVSAGRVESILLTNGNATKFRAASMRSSLMTSSDNSTSGLTSDAVVQRRSIVYTDGRPGTLRCVAVALASPVRVEVYVGRRNVTAELRTRQTVTTGGQRGLRLQRYHVEVERHDFLPSVDEAGRRLTCNAYLEGEDRAANSTSARLIVRRKYQTLSEIYCELFTVLTALIAN